MPTAKRVAVDHAQRPLKMVSHPQPGMPGRAPYDPRRGPMRTLRSFPPARHGATVWPRKCGRVSPNRAARVRGFVHLFPAHGQSLPLVSQEPPALAARLMMFMLPVAHWMVNVHPAIRQPSAVRLSR